MVSWFWLGCFGTVHFSESSSSVASARLAIRVGRAGFCLPSDLNIASWGMNPPRPKNGNGQTPPMVGVLRKNISLGLEPRIVLGGVEETASRAGGSPASWAQG